MSVFIPKILEILWVRFVGTPRTTWQLLGCFARTFRTIYEKLAEAVSDEEKELYQQRCSEISPNIRYCEYNVGDESAAEDLMQMRRQIGREDPLTARLDVRSELVD